jgi:Do/DeqQ family serine protease
MSNFLSDSRERAARLARMWLVLVVVFVVGACQKGSTAASVPASSSDAGTNVSAPAPSSATAQSSYADVVSRVAPAVVTIRAEKRVRAGQQFPFADDPFFRDFFGQGRRTPRQQEDEAPQERLQRGTGSGVIVSADGYILTNYHVIDGAENIRVELGDNRTLDAKVVGTDQPSDLAVIKIEGGTLPYMQLGDSDRVRVGDVVLAIGNPLDVGQTVTMGIISAKGRQTGPGSGNFEDFLQTDAPINRGNSGGALVSTSGELIGINSQILSSTGMSIGIGFAIPSNMAKSVMEQLVKTGKVRRGQLGIVVQKVTSDVAASLGMRDPRGVIVSQVQAGKAAERAGLKVGDVVTAINGQRVDDPNTFRNRVAATAPGTEVALTVVRDEREQQLRATLGEFQPETADAGDGEGQGGGDAARRGGTGRLGLTLEPLTPEMAARLRVESNVQGLVVTDVDPSGPAGNAGIREGDVIVEVNRQPVRSVADITAALNRATGRPLLLLVHSRGTSGFVTVRPRQ